ncbi:hypothetical protein MATL_G00206790 [Megalops atlanticus]|uniref:Uncharacterized protein n=1 Tax=Megalops atlanticus TaxID=7932 RepID=A0A9D3SY47_MEGAT|nr:hypothetical protein MATL_G00206790 [Megalops atlanticus]
MWVKGGETFRHTASGRRRRASRKPPTAKRQRHNQADRPGAGTEVLPAWGGGETHLAKRRAVRAEVSGGEPASYSAHAGGSEGCIMAPVGAGMASWATSGSPSPEVTFLSSILFLVLMIGLLALCTHCNRQSFDLQHIAKEEKSFTLIRMVKLEEVPGTRENPRIDDITKDEKVFSPVPEKEIPHDSSLPGDVLYTPWRAHTGALHQQGDINQGLNHTTLGDPGVLAGPKIQWPQDQEQHDYESLEDVRQATSEFSPTTVTSLEDELEDPAYKTIEELSESDCPLTPPLHQSQPLEGGAHLLALPTVEGLGEDLSGRSLNVVYAKVNRKSRNLEQTEEPPPPPSNQPPEVEEEKEEGEEEEEESPPPIPERGFELDDSFSTPQISIQEVQQNQQQ